MNFAIPTASESKVRFTIRVDEDDKLTELIAEDGETIYDCKIQLSSRENSGLTYCCSPEFCIPGSC